MEFLDLFKKWKKEELDKHNTHSKKKKKLKKVNNSEKNKILLRLKHRSKYLSIEMDLVNEQLQEAKSKMFEAIIKYCQEHPEAKNPLVPDKESAKESVQQITEAEEDEAKALYREIAKATHPDKEGKDLTEVFIHATEAKDTNKIDELVEISFDLDIDLTEISVDFLEKIEKDLNEKEKIIKDKRQDIALQWMQASKDQRSQLIKMICPIEKN